MGDNDYKGLQDGWIDADCYIPELWAEEALAMLEENIALYNLLIKDK